MTGGEAPPSAREQALRDEISALTDELAIMNGRRIACLMVSETDARTIARLTAERDACEAERVRQFRTLADLGVKLRAVRAERDAAVAHATASAAEATALRRERWFAWQVTADKSMAPSLSTPTEALDTPDSRRL